MTRTPNDEVERRCKRLAELRHWFFQTLTPEQRRGFLVAWGFCNNAVAETLSLGLQDQMISAVSTAAIASMVTKP
jgi:hypothetical protein